MEAWDEEIKKLAAELNIPVEGTSALYARTGWQWAREQGWVKKIKYHFVYIIEKRLKKFSIEKEDGIDAAVEKTKKLVLRLFTLSWMKSIKTMNWLLSSWLKLKDLSPLFPPVPPLAYSGKTERDSSVNQVKRTEGLQKQFKKKYDDILKEAQ